MTMAEAQAWGMIIGLLTTSIISIITALKVGKVHTLVNSAMTAEKAENQLLRSVLAAKEIEIAAAEKARAILAAKPAPVAVIAVPPVVPAVAPADPAPVIIMPGV